jgi:hypothetical protein
LLQDLPSGEQTTPPQTLLEQFLVQQSLGAMHALPSGAQVDAHTPAWHDPPQQSASLVHIDPAGTQASTHTPF